MRKYLQDQLAVQLTCGQFSYAEIPKNFFDVIMGVTGTLGCLSVAEKAIIHDDYKIRKFTINTSMYGGSQLYAPKDSILLAEDVHRHYQMIGKEITDEQAKGKPVLVFFESEVTGAVIFSFLFHSCCYMPCKFAIISKS